VLPKWAWSGSREQFLHCGLRRFRHSKSSVYRWYPQLVRGRFVYDTSDTMKVTRSRHGWVHILITHCLQLNFQLHTMDLVRTCHTSSFCTVAWQLARFQLTRRIARSLGDSWASCTSCRSSFTKNCSQCWSASLLLILNGLYTRQPVVLPVASCIRSFTVLRPFTFSLLQTLTLKLLQLPTPLHLNTVGLNWYHEIEIVCWWNVM